MTMQKTMKTTSGVCCILSYQANVCGCHVESGQFTQIPGDCMDYPAVETAEEAINRPRDLKYSHIHISLFTRESVCTANE